MPGSDSEALIMNIKQLLRAVIAILSIALAVPASAQCTGELTGNGIVDGADLGTILAYWGPRTQDPTSIASDLNVDGLINGADLGVLLASWGPCQSTIISITPNQGSVLGGSQVTITGSYLSSTMAVSVGGTAATNFTVVNQNTVQATTPAGALGPAAVQLTTASGIVESVAGFQYFSLAVPPWATLIEGLPDPAVVTDPSLRAAITATGRAWRVRDIGTQMEMLLIPPGVFQMGCIMGSNGFVECYSWELPVHTVTLTNAFYIGRYEVTQAQWVATMGYNPSYFRSWVQSPTHPVELVSWTAIQGYLAATGMRLPSEAEWEYACRAGTETPYYNGSIYDNTLGSLAWYYASSGSVTHPVGGKTPNGFGLYDMLGNVFEWVSDWYATYPSTAQFNPSGPASASSRVFRGGSWGDAAGRARSSSRAEGPPGGTYSLVGFRVARNP